MLRAVHACLPLMLLLAVLPQAAAAAPATDPVPIWDELSGELPARSASGAPAVTRPERFSAFTLDQPALRARLAGTPIEGSSRAPQTISIPGPGGALQRFAAVESPLLARSAQRRFPSIRTYAATGIDDPMATARFDVTPLGFRASVRSERGAWLVDPRYRNDRSVYVSYYRRDIDKQQSPLVEPAEAAELLLPRVRARAPQRAPGEAVIQRTYRLALANDPSYAEHFGGTDLLVESAKASLMNRVNQLYNDDLAIRMEFVPDNYKLNFQTQQEYARAGYGSGECSGSLLDDNQAAIDSIIGDANYDIGHLVKKAGGGGIAALQSVGQPGLKAQGCTGVDPPIGDGFAIDYVAHEMGHQFGGPHTFDGVNGNCAPPNRDLTGEAAVEPGSGTSIQAYAGICDADDLQPNSDPYFSQQSIDDILGYVADSNDPNATEEGTEETVANRSPVVTAPPDRTIPVQTPFTLPGSATDPDGDGLVYIWEQNDAGGPVGKPLEADGKTHGPLFRVFSLRALEDRLQSPAPGQNIAREVDKVRTFPDLAQIAAGNTNAESGSCATVADALARVDCYSEYLPTPTYAQGEMNFRLTARDRDITGGGVSTDDVTISVDPASTPFAVAAPEGPQSLTGGTTTTVTWNRGRTPQPPIGVTAVRISYSTDGGLTFGYEVLASTPNDGSEVVTVPNVETTAGRFKVEAIGNYFFDVSDGDLAVAQGAGAIPTATATATPSPTAAPTVRPVTPGLPSASPTATTTSTATPTATATTTATATATSTGTPTATATASPGPTAVPTRGFLRPSLRPTASRIRVKGNRKVKLRVRCEVVPVTTASACRGSAALFAKIDEGKRRRIGKKRITVARGTTRTVRVRINRRAFRNLTDSGSLRAKARVRANARTARKSIELRR